jgi:thiol:disulfide interchange protein DsbD
VVDNNLLLAFFLAFIGGILTSLTPCIFPMLPITIGVIGAKNTRSAFQGFSLSVVYILGIAFTYALLGVFAALTGSLFGSVLQNPVIVVIIALIFFLMGLSMFDIFYVQVPTGLQSKLAKIYQKQATGSFSGVAVMGLISGLIATPCVGPVIVSMLTYVAQTKNVFLGFWLLFTFAVGMGLILVVLGTFSNALVNMPRAGGWMEQIKKGIGLVMIAVAFYYLKPVLPAYLFNFLAGSFLVIAGMFFGAGLPLQEDSPPAKKLRKSAGLLVVTAGLYLFVISLGGLNPSGNNQSIVSKPEGKTAEKVQLKWLSSEEEGLKLAKLENKYAMIDFYADWCPACIELDKYTYTDKEVISSLQDFVTVKIDATKSTPQVKALFSKYGIVGLPAVIFIDKSGNVLQDYSLAGFEKPKVFINRLNQVKSSNEQQAAGFYDRKPS